MPYYYGLQAIIVSISAFVRQPLDVHRDGGCEAAPYDFLRSAPAPRGPTELSPSASAAAGRLHATRSPAGPRIEMQGLHHCTERTARRAQRQQSSIGERIAAPASNRAARRRRAREPCSHHPALAMRRCSSL